VLTPFRRQGIATALLRATLPFIDALGKTVVSVGTSVADGHAFVAAIGSRRSIAAWRTGWTWRCSIGTWSLHGMQRRFRRGCNGRATAGGRRCSGWRRFIRSFPNWLRTMPLGALETPPLRYEIAATKVWYEEMTGTAARTTWCC